jgi:hypothetical protein
MNESEMNAFRAALVLILAGLLAACGDNSQPPAPAPPAQTTATPTVRTQPAPVAPLPTTAVEQPQVAVTAPQPAPASQRPLSRQQQAALQPLFGVWAADLNSCDRGAIEISQTRFQGAENGCDIISFVDTGNWNFIATLSCQSQGQAIQERIGMIPLYAPSGEAIGMTYLDRNNQAVTVYRCD